MEFALTVLETVTLWGQMEYVKLVMTVLASLGIHALLTPKTLYTDVISMVVMEHAHSAKVGLKSMKEIALFHLKFKVLKTDKLHLQQ
jgi:hypothetical protein